MIALNAATAAVDIEIVTQAARSRAAARFVGAANDNDNMNVVATPYAWIDASKIPRRQWLFGQHYIRGFLTATIAPGAGGKSANAIVESLSIASGKPLLGGFPAREKHRVWYVNCEDPLVEIQRRFAAAAKHYDLSAQDIGDRLMVDSGRDQSFVVAQEMGKGVTVFTARTESIIDEMKRKQVDILILDPFVSTHAVEENSNSKIQQVVSEWARVANDANASVELIHHVRKISNGNEVTADDGRGGSAIKDKARSVRVLNPMTPDECAKAGLTPGEHRGKFRLNEGKPNMLAAGQDSHWRQIVSVDLCNGGPSMLDFSDSVGVVTAWSWPTAESLAEAVTTEQLDNVKRMLIGLVGRESHLSPDWAGRFVLDVIGGDPKDKSDRARATYLLKEWIKQGHLEVQEGQHPTGRRMINYIVST